jgi:hypothetical protein
MMVAGGIAIAATLTACRGGGAQPPKSAPVQTAPSASTTPSPTPTPGFGIIPTDPTVVGRLDVMIAMTTPNSVVPKSPITYTLLVHPAGDEVATPYPVDPDGTFALPLTPGSYDMAVLEIDAADLGTESVVLPLTTSQALRLTAPSTGCVYGGEVHIVFGRLPSGTQQQQQTLVERASRNNHEDYSFVYRRDGGFVIAGASVSLAAQNQRPGVARSCAGTKFTWVKA